MLFTTHTVSTNVLAPESEQGPHEERLIDTIFETRRYNRLARPAPKEEEALEVQFGVALQQIVDVVRSATFDPAV